MDRKHCTEKGSDTEKEVGGWKERREEKASLVWGRKQRRNKYKSFLKMVGFRVVSALDV